MRIIFILALCMVLCGCLCAKCEQLNGPLGDHIDIELSANEAFFNYAVEQKALGLAISPLLMDYINQNYISSKHIKEWKHGK